MAQEKVTDPNIHLTKHLTGAEFQKILERSRYDSPQELRLVVFLKIQEQLVWRGFGAAVETYSSAKLSVDGASRKEDIEAMKASAPADRAFHTGFATMDIPLEMEKEEIRRRGRNGER